MSPVIPIYYTTVRRGAKFLEELLLGKADVRFNEPILDSAYSDRHPAFQDIFWIVEVAKTSIKKDLDIKTAIYASAASREYWVLDLSVKQMIVFRNPQIVLGYGLHGTVHEDLIVVVAGYKGEMSRFINSNPGFKSRFLRSVHLIKAKGWVIPTQSLSTQVQKNQLRDSKR